MILADPVRDTRLLKQQEHQPSYIRCWRCSETTRSRVWPEGRGRRGPWQGLAEFCRDSSRSTSTRSCPGRKQSQRQRAQRLAGVGLLRVKICGVSCAQTTVQAVSGTAHRTHAHVQLAGSRTGVQRCQGCTTWLSTVAAPSICCPCNACSDLVEATLAGAWISIAAAVIMAFLFGMVGATTQHSLGALFMHCGEGHF